LQEQEHVVTQKKSVSDLATGLSNGNQLLATQCDQAEETITIRRARTETKYRYRK